MPRGVMMLFGRLIKSVIIKNDYVIFHFLTSKSYSPMFSSTSTSTITLSKDQETALTGLISFLDQKFIKNNINSYCATLSGYAGTGKTTLTKEFLRIARIRKMKVAGVAPTHKAKKVLARTLNNKSFIQIATLTVASLLLKTREHSYTGTKNFSNNSKGGKISDYDLLLIDEVSMVSDRDFDDIIKHANIHGTKIIFIGDDAQIPNPAQAFIKNSEGFLVKKISKAFSLKHHLSLTKIIRQGSSNPLISVYDFIRQNINSPIKLPKKSEINAKGEGITWCTDYFDFADKIKEAFTNPKYKKSSQDYADLRVIAYTNDRVTHYNREIRIMIKRMKDIDVGEILMGYENVGFPYKVIENGQDYIVTKIVLTKTHEIELRNKTFSKLVGKLITVKEIDTPKISTLFFPDINSGSNFDVLMELVKRAENNNENHSTRLDFAKYAELKNQMIFLQNVYRIKGVIMTSADAKNAHPLLFTNVTQIIDERDDGDRKVIINEPNRQIHAKYPDIIKERALDSKSVAVSEKLIDRYLIINKDIDYGYAITSHKSQGSTYEKVFIDENDFSRVKNSWNYRLGATEDRTREINQLKYVAFTRPTLKAIVLGST